MSDRRDYVDGNKTVGRNGVPWRFTEKQFTPWGDLGVFKEMLTGLGWEQALASAAWPQPQHRSGADDQGLPGHRLGRGWSLCPTAMVRFDDALRAIFGLKQVANTRGRRRFTDNADGKQELPEETVPILSQFRTYPSDHTALAG